MVPVKYFVGKNCIGLGGSSLKQSNRIEIIREACAAGIQRAGARRRGKRPSAAQSHRGPADSAGAARSGKVHSIDGLVRAMAKTAFTGRQLGEAADVLEAMALDEDAFIVMTLAGAMTVAKQGLIVTELIDRGIVNAIVSTGALMAHGLVEATGRAHFRANPEVSDEELYEQGYNRVYDTLEPEQNLDDVEEVMSAVLEGWDHNEVMCSYKLNHAIGAYLAKRDQGAARDFEVGV